MLGGHPLSALHLTLACGDYDLLRPLIEGTVRPKGIDLTAITLSSPERHWRMLRHEEFDICELSMASYLADRSRSSRFVAIPVFPHRRFRHSYIFVATEGRIRETADLNGARVGLRTFQTTAGVWVRGILQHEYHVDLTSIRWLTQDAEDVPLDAARRFHLEQVAPGARLDRMLVSGELDAVIYPEVLPEVYANPPAARRLFEDYKAEERAYFARTGIFPIMHTVAFPAGLIERYPWVAVNMMQAFEASKQECYRRLRDPRRISLAWAMALLEEQDQVMGADPWAYGLEPNRAALDAITLYAQEQGLTAVRFDPQELFVKAALEEIPKYLE